MNELKITHEQFCEQLKDLCHRLGYRVARFRPAMTAHGWRTPVAGDGKGFLDYTIAREETEYHPGRLIYAEVKIPPDKLRPEQKEWFDLLKATGKAEVYLWTPDDFDEIVKILQDGPE